jgi:putative flippase GtrA
MPELWLSRGMLMFWLQLAGFMLIGTLGVAVNGIVYQTLMNTKVGQHKVLPMKKLKDITVAWCFGIFVAFIFNFLLDKYLVFQA